MRLQELVFYIGDQLFLPISKRRHCNLRLNLTHELHTLKPSTPLSKLLGRKDPAAFAGFLALSSKLKSLLVGIQVHGEIIKSGFSEDTFSQNNLIIMYSKCGAFSNCIKVFDEMRERNAFSWTSMISGAIQNEEFEMGLEIYMDMVRSGFGTNEFALGSVLKGCANLGAVEFGSLVHCVALKMGMDMNAFVGSSILYMYAKYGDLESAIRVFESMDNCDVGCWNAMIGGYALNGCFHEAMKLVFLMHRKGIIMDQLTFINALKGCSMSGGLNLGRQIHGLMVRSKLECTPGINSLMYMYFKTGEHDSALKLFNKMEERDIISWNTVFSGFSEDENVGEVVGMFSRMLLTGVMPNHVTFSILFRLCGTVLHLGLGLQLYCLVFHLGLGNEALVVNSLINMFSVCGALECAHFVFYSVPCKNTSTWNEIILGCNLNCCTMEALKHFCSLWNAGVEANECTFSSILLACSRTEHQEICRQIHGSIIKSGFGFHAFVCSSLINAYARYGLVDDLYKIFYGIRRLDLACWGAMISALVQGGCSYEALEFLNCLKQAGEKLDEFILGSSLNACANITSNQQTRCIHLLAMKTGFENHVYVASAIIDAYAKCGDIESSRLEFDQFSGEDDVILFNTMIMAYAHHGLVMEATEIFKKMKSSSLQPSHATFVSVISACSHLGLVDQGQRFFDSLISDYGMEPSAEIFGCLVDLFSRNGFLEEAKYVIQMMPFDPWPSIWRSFLSGCRIHGNKALAEWATRHLLELVPKSDAAYVLLSKVYSEGGYWEDASKIRKRMKEKGVQKEPGYSWIEI
ncbi:PREDICTED: putative pentatricopeptide repeat-containing protein At3g25970 [Nelumbo nucifera]|uniref:Pentatricopeptide repeat-containing protein At3g25970 n=2 Tax=Nelumbo nucifera TaxID=4432 RepID=A0A1U7ZDQ9_NELNU|nr:PREDICTED: putative pentatricopeptide repeat-containing protein At3g25970 [Nelumbo nucifera]DAD35955.1 TPA_asm: hypothetical protein HUJ06_006595 [Nelumbo nucifera]